jgi:hypothetical protein
MFKQLETQIKNQGKSGFESRTKIMWSSSVSAWSHIQLLSQSTRDGFSEHFANSVCFLSVLFISLGSFYISLIM